MLKFIDFKTYKTGFGKTKDLSHINFKGPQIHRNFLALSIFLGSYRKETKNPV